MLENAAFRLFVYTADQIQEITLTDTSMLNKLEEENIEHVLEQYMRYTCRRVHIVLVNVSLLPATFRQ